MPSISLLLREVDRWFKFYRFSLFIRVAGQVETEHVLNEWVLEKESERQKSMLFCCEAGPETKIPMYAEKEIT